MKIRKFTIPMYGYKVTFAELEKKDTCKDVKKVCPIIKGADFTEEICSRVKEKLIDGGEFIYNHRRKECLIFLYLQSSEKSRLETLGHEVRHCVDRILEHSGVDDIESAALLSGYLTMKIFK